MELLYCGCCGYGRTELPYRALTYDGTESLDCCRKCEEADCSVGNYCEIGADVDDAIPVDAADMAYVYESLGITPRDPEEGIA